MKKIPRSLSKKEGGDFFVPEHLFSKQYVPWKSCLFMALFHIWAGILFLKIFKRHFCFCKMQNKSAFFPALTPQALFTDLCREQRLIFYVLDRLHGDFLDIFRVFVIVTAVIAGQMIRSDQLKSCLQLPAVVVMF